MGGNGSHPQEIEATMGGMGWPPARCGRSATCARRTGRASAVRRRGQRSRWWHVALPNSPWHFASGDVGVRGEPRYHGEDNRAVLGELLG